MAHVNSSLSRLNSLIVHQSRNPTRTAEHAIVLHQIAAAKYKHVQKKLRNITDDQQLPLSDIYLGFKRVAGVHGSCDLHTLFTRFNDIARKNFVAHPELDEEANKLIFYYGMDQLHTFNIHLRQSYFNIVLAVFTLASGCNNKLDPQYRDSADLWCSFVFAWLESITSRGEDVFIFREEFLQQWLKSKYDLTYFSNIKKKRMEKVLNELKAGKPPVQGDPIDFLDQCRRGKFQHKEFARVGMAMAMHWILAQIKLAKEEKSRKKEAVMRAAMAKKVTTATQVNLGALLDEEWEDDSDEEEEDEDEEDEADGEEDQVEDEEEEVDEMDIEVGEDRNGELQDGGEDMELNEDGMELDDNDFEPIPDDIDLTRVDWDAPWMQALLDIDITIKWEEGSRPESDRIEWIHPTKGFNALFTKGDQLAEDMRKFLHIDKQSTQAPVEEENELG